MYFEPVWKYILIHICVAVPCRYFDHTAAYLNHIAAFQAPHRTYALCGLVRCLFISKEHMGSAFNGNSAIGWSECSNVIEICNEISTQYRHIYTRFASSKFDFCLCVNKLVLFTLRRVPPHSQGHHNAQRKCAGNGKLLFVDKLLQMLDSHHTVAVTM